MKELNSPPAHHTPRQDMRQSLREHDRQREESRPTEAPDVENRRQEDRWSDGVRPRHPVA